MSCVLVKRKGSVVGVFVELRGCSLIFLERFKGLQLGVLMGVKEMLGEPQPCLLSLIMTLRTGDNFKGK